MQLVSLDSVKRYLGIATHDATHDAALVEWIDDASAIIASYCNHPIALNTRTREQFDGDGSTVFSFKVFPVVSVTALEYRSGVGSGATWHAIEPTEYELVASDSTGYMIEYAAGFLAGHNNYRVSYTFGYADIPGDIRRVAREMVVEVFRDMFAPGGGGEFRKSSIGETAPGGGALNTQLKDLSAAHRAKLNPYRVWNI